MGTRFHFQTSALIPTLTTTVASSVSATSATSGGNISSDGGAAVTARGVCWSTSSNPTISGSKTSDAAGSGIFTSTITGLTAGTTYYIRAYATNSIGPAYGNEGYFYHPATVRPPSQQPLLAALPRLQQSAEAILPMMPAIQLPHVVYAGVQPPSDDFEQ